MKRNLLKQKRKEIFHVHLSCSCFFFFSLFVFFRLRCLTFKQPEFLQNICFLKSFMHKFTQQPEGLVYPTFPKRQEDWSFSINQYGNLTINRTVIKLFYQSNRFPFFAMLGKQQTDIFKRLEMKMKRAKQKQKREETSKREKIIDSFFFHVNDLMSPVFHDASLRWCWTTNNIVVSGCFRIIFSLLHHNIELAIPTLIFSEENKSKLEGGAWLNRTSLAGAGGEKCENQFSKYQSKCPRVAGEILQILRSSVALQCFNKHQFWFRK